MKLFPYKKKLGLEVELKKPMIKTGFFIPKRLQIIPLKKDENDSNKKSSEENIKLKSKNLKNEIILPYPIQITGKKKITRKMIRKNITNLKIKTRHKLQKTNKRIENILENIEDNNEILTPEEKDSLKNIKKENNKAKKEIDEWLQFVLSHTKELISTYKQQNDMSIKKLKEIEKKLGNFKKGETLIKNPDNSQKKEHPGICCSQCKENVVGIRYKCLVCKEFNFCEKCEKKFEEEHRHPMLKINNPEMCPVSINCSFSSINNN